MGGDSSKQLGEEFLGSMLALVGHVFTRNSTRRPWWAGGTKVPGAISLGSLTPMGKLALTAARCLLCLGGHAQTDFPSSLVTQVPSCSTEKAKSRIQ